MTVLVTGSAGHLGEGLMRTLRRAGQGALGIDIKPSAFTDRVGSIADRAFVKGQMEGVATVFHVATLHKPHVATHPYADFVATNVSATLILLEEALAAGVEQFVFTSTTSAFGSALAPGSGEPAAWVTEDVVPIPKNIYGATKIAAESLCELFARRHRLPVIVLRTSRFFPEADDDRAMRATYATDNVQANELLNRRVDLSDVVSAHLRAAERARDLGFGRYIVSATTPFTQGDLAALRVDAPEVVLRLFPQAEALYAGRQWRLFPTIDRVYVNDRARSDLGWQPRHDFGHVLACLTAGTDFLSPLAREVGSKGYHDEVFTEGPYPVAT